jgi:hypothetical protein
MRFFNLNWAPKQLTLSLNLSLTPRDGLDSNYLQKCYFCFSKYIIDIYEYWKIKIVHESKISCVSILE